jgi:hypothetical protein
MQKHKEEKKHLRKLKMIVKMKKSQTIEKTSERSK